MTAEALAREPAAETGPWLTPEQIEDRWGIKPAAVYAAINAGKLPRSKIGQTVLVEKGDLDAWFRSEKKTITQKEQT